MKAFAAAKARACLKGGSDVDVKLVRLRREFYMVVLVALASFACGYNPNPVEGAQACGSGAKKCPDGYSCIQGNCWRMPPGSGGRLGQGGPPDGAAPGATDAAMGPSRPSFTGAWIPTSGSFSARCGSSPAQPDNERFDVIEAGAGRIELSFGSCALEFEHAGDSAEAKLVAQKSTCERASSVAVVKLTYNQGRFVVNGNAGDLSLAGEASVIGMSCPFERRLVAERAR